MSRRKHDKRSHSGKIECNGRFVENLEVEDCKLIIAPTRCFSDVECFEDTVRFKDLCPAPAEIPPLEAKVFVTKFCARFIDEDTIRKTVKYKVYIRYLSECGHTVEKVIERTFTQKVDVKGKCNPDVCADDKDGSFLCRVTDICVRSACLEDDDEIVVEIVGRLSLELFVKQRHCVQLCKDDCCPRIIEESDLCIKDHDCKPCKCKHKEDDFCGKCW